MDTIEITYNVKQATHKGYLGYKPVVRGHLYDSLFYRSVGLAMKAAEHMAKAEAITLKKNGHKTIVKNGRV